MNGEKRAYSRVAANLPCRLRLMASADASPLYRENALPDASATAETFQGAMLPEAVVTFLLGLNKKLDIIIGLLQHDSLLDNFPLKAEVVEISGAGIKIHCPEPLQTGQHVEVVMVLSHIPPLLAGAVGKVVRMENDPGHVFALDFTRIREADLDAVIRFVFQEERRQIRERKWD